MQNAYIISGSLSDGQTVILDEALPVMSGRVRLVVEPLPSESTSSYGKVVSDIRERQRKRGHQAPSPHEIAEYLESERAAWD